MSAFRLTSEWLAAKGACSGAVDPFLAAYPDGAALTRELLDDPLVMPHLHWLAGNLPLTVEAYRAYGAATVEARRAFDAARAEARRAYYAATVEARHAYGAATVEARHAYGAATVEAYRAFDAARAEARRAFDAARAEALWQAIVASGLARVGGEK